MRNALMMRTIFFAVALLTFTASAHAGVRHNHVAACLPHKDQINGHTVTIQCAPNNIDAYEEWRNGDGKLDRDEAPASMVRDTATSTVVYELWYKDGQLHRADGPAVIQRVSSTGNVVVEQWFRDGVAGRADGPYIIMRDAKTGALVHEEWLKDGQTIVPPQAAAR
jgi:hypothetical protein